MPSASGAPRTSDCRSGLGVFGARGQPGWACRDSTRPGRGLSGSTAHTRSSGSRSGGRYCRAGPVKGHNPERLIQRGCRKRGGSRGTRLRYGRVYGSRRSGDNLGGGVGRFHGGPHRRCCGGYSQRVRSGSDSAGPFSGSAGGPHYLPEAIGGEAENGKYSYYRE